jgi:tryptophan 7-halogenase
MSDNSKNLIKHVIVVGGGTAGWLTANHLAKRFNAAAPNSIQVTLVESPDIPTIGVGEGTVPAIRKTLQYLGISESDFIRECDATFKQSIKFVDWVKNPSGNSGNNYYHHLFDFPCIQPFDLSPYWLLNTAEELSYANAVSIQERICELGLAPKQMVDPEYVGVTNYAYHLDAAKFARLLTKHGVDKLGVKHHSANVQQVIISADGNIEKLVTDNGEVVADFFVDCSGFSALLIGQQLGVGFIDKKSTLFADYALAAQVPYSEENTPIPCYTIATAKESGWIWDIGLTSRRGTGYVYSSAHTNHERAEDVLRAYLGPQHKDVTCRKIPMNVGYREKFWVKNCAAIGLSQGFVEPLEATGLLVYDATARMLADLFPARFDEIPAAAAQFNLRARHAWEKVIDFVKLHYFISQRDDSDFWLDNRVPETVSDELLAKLANWRYQLPTEYDFPGRMEIFNLENYLYVLYGMSYSTELHDRASRYLEGVRAQSVMQKIQQQASATSKQLLPHRELIDRINRYGLQKY